MNKYYYYADCDNAVKLMESMGYINPLDLIYNEDNIYISCTEGGVILPISKKDKTMRLILKFDGINILKKRNKYEKK